MDDFGKYTLTDAGITLTETDFDENVLSYVIKPGTVALYPSVFANAPQLLEITIPASLQYIPEGTLSNGEGWASDLCGIRKIHISEGNTHFVQIKNCFCKKEDDGSLTLLRVTGEGTSVEIPSEIKKIGKDAFKNCRTEKVFIESYGLTVWFPVSHAFFLSDLLANFGKNGKLYDFAPYDAFLLRKHFNAERIHMISERLGKPYDMTKEVEQKIRRHVSDSFEDICEFMSLKGTVSSLSDLADIGFFTKDNIDQCIDVLNLSQNTELKQWLIEYKNRTFGYQEFDFDL